MCYSLRPESEFSTQPKSSAVKTQLQQVRFDKNIAPLGCQEPTPMEMFLYHSQATTCGREPGKNKNNNYNFAIMLWDYDNT